MRLYYQYLHHVIQFFRIELLMVLNVQDFNAAAERVKTLTKRPTDEEFLELYGLFKQATVGDNNTAKPGMFDLKGKAKWEWWNKQKGKSQDDAKTQYIEFVNQLVVKYA